MSDILRLQTNCSFTRRPGLASIFVEQCPVSSIYPRKIKVTFQPENDIDSSYFSGKKIVISRTKMFLHRGRGKSVLTFDNPKQFFSGVEKLVITPFFIRGISKGKRIFQIIF